MADIKKIKNLYNLNKRQSGSSLEQYLPPPKLLSQRSKIDSSRGQLIQDQRENGAAVSTKEITEVKDQVKKLVEYQRIVEKDENLGIPEVQAALEIVNHFNQNMPKIQSNMNGLLALMQQMGSAAARQQEHFWKLEGKIIEQVDKQNKVEKKCSLLLDRLGL